MQDPVLLRIALLSWGAGLTALLGGLLAAGMGIPRTEVRKELLHGVVAFGGGVLVAAVAFALLPDAMERLSLPAVLIPFLLGGGVVCLLDAAIARSGGSQAQLLAMLLDFVPEAVAFGAVFASDPASGFLLAGFIGVQNLPEGFNAFREIHASGEKTPRTLLLLAATSLLGPVSACTGFLLLQNHPGVTAGMMAAASGGILYLVFQDIAPQAVMKRHWTPPLGAVLGFSLGMAGQMLLG